ncbi:MAG: hypothetical protein A2231_13270 [Candidatus Firestonebacteria bacterium RIFOXYA2_FULL_40_8]|nr:MAG: hypothetical protein A2231_13270 [Candidatus Firestonebacteria bacterium RIFOXYA2_FULL_40_8]
MSINSKLVLAFFTFLPLLFVFVLTFVIIVPEMSSSKAIDSSNAKEQFVKVRSIMEKHMAGVPFISFNLVFIYFFYMLNVFLSKNLRISGKIFWMFFLTLAPVLSPPFYWYFQIWREKEKAGAGFTIKWYYQI